MSRYVRDYPKRDGFRTERSNFGYGTCANCNHDSLDHFWWISSTGGTEIGCHGCPDKICLNKQEGNKMSAINLCERCDAFMLGKAVAVIRLDKTPSSYTETLEICPACVTDFMDFMHSAPTRDKNVFREPYKEPEPPADAPALTTGG